MKIAVFLLIFALGFMWYRGDFGHRPEELGLPPIPQIVKTAPMPKQEDFNRKIQAESRQATASEVIVKDAKVKPLGLEVFSKEKSAFVAQTLWLESHKVEEERTMLDKLRNLASFGKYE